MTFAEVLGSPPELANRIRVTALTDSVTSTEEQVSKTRTMVGKLRLVLSDFFKIMFPDRLVPDNIDALINSFMGTNALVEFSRAQTLSGAETVIALTHAHGIQANFKAAFSRFPVDSTGEEVDIQPFQATAGTLAEKLLAMLEAREKTLEEFRAHEAAEQ